MQISEISRELLLKAIGSREENSNKSDYGYIALLGGCPEYAGAARLAYLAYSATAAMRAGAGVVRLIVPLSIASAMLPNMLESTLKFLPANEYGAVKYEKAAMDAAFAGIKAVGIGMGLGQNGNNAEIIEYILNSGIPAVFDADALNTLAKHPDLLAKKRTDKIILTPHPGEFSRLTGLSIPEILSAPAEYAVDFARKHGVTVLLKGHESFITDGKTVYRNDRGTPGMATAGSGDVLTGIITALLYRNDDPASAAAAGAYIAGAAGEAAAEKYGAVGMISPDTVEFIAFAIKNILDGKI